MKQDSFGEFWFFLLDFFFPFKKFLKYQIYEINKKAQDKKITSNIKIY